MNLSQVIVKPVLTEKSVQGAEMSKYTFIVHENATKVDVKIALGVLYGVKTKAVNILRGLPKFRVGRGRNLIQKRANTRRAIVTLRAGEKLDLSKLKQS
jgi:large subunit ribosomal protein L23